MRLPSLQIGDLTARLPIIQGAMGVGVSLSGLASAVANEGGVGVISGVQIGYDEPDFEEDNELANTRALRKHIRRARELSPSGILGVNLMTAITNYKDMVKVAVEEKIDLIVSGAGIPKILPGLTKGSSTKIAPIVSSGKAANLIAKIWDKRYKCIPHLVIVEGPDAGGHLGFSVGELQGNQKPNLEEIILEVIEALKPYVDKYKQKIPVIAAGGIFTGQDIARYINLGVDGVQLGTRFVPTEECDAARNFKEAYINSTKDSIQLIKSPVGMPGRAIRNEFVKTVEKEKIPVNKCYNCLIPCSPGTTDYCISKALINSVQGDVDHGLIFAGSNAYKISEMTTVKKLVTELVAEAETKLVE